jgi:hypothetical protein
MTFSTWDESAENAVGIIYQMIRHNPKIKISDIRQCIDDFIDEMFHQPAGFAAARTQWSILGATALEWGQKNNIKLNEDTLVKLLIRKQRDYGHENIRRFGRQGLMVRMHDKIARLENLVSGNKTPENESVFDTVCDIAGYSAIGIMWESREFLLPLGQVNAPGLAV